MKEIKEFKDAVDRIATLYRRLPNIAATVAVNFSKERFRAQAWVDTEVQPWRQRKEAWGGARRKVKQGRAILVQSGRLRRSIRKITVTDTYAVIGTDVAYARAHNEGLAQRVKQQVKSFTRQKPTRKGRSKDGRSAAAGDDRVTVRAHSRTIKQNIPRRQFIGESAQLNKEITHVIAVELIKALRNQ